jgi:hypothetical protein
MFAPHFRKDYNRGVRNIGVMLFVLAVPAMAQMTGLPQAGVTLVGNACEPRNCQ